MRNSSPPSRKVNYTRKSEGGGTITHIFNFLCNDFIRIDWLPQTTCFFEKKMSKNIQSTHSQYIVHVRTAHNRFFRFFLGDHTFPLQSTTWLGRVSRSFCKFWVKISVLRSNHVYSCLEWAKKTTFHYSIIKIAHLDVEIKFDFDPHVFFGFYAYFYLCLFLYCIKPYKGRMRSLALTNIIFSKTVFRIAEVLYNHNV